MTPTAPPRRPGPQSLVFLAGAVGLLGLFVVGIARAGNWLAPSVRLLAALTLKNAVNRQWRPRRDSRHAQVPVLGLH